MSIFDKEGCFVKACGNNLKDVKAMHIDSRGNLYMLVKAGITVCLSSLGLNQFNLFKEKILIIRQLLMKIIIAILF